MNLDRLALYRSAGLQVRDERVPGRPGRIFAPMGMMEHHTASAAGSGDIPSLSVVKYGRADVAGPLCNDLVGRSGLIVLVTDGSANHSGGGNSGALDRFWRCAPPERPATADDHRHISDLTLGREIENNGIGEPYPQAQLDAILRCDELLYEAWGIVCVNRVIGHREWTRRKIDPTFDMPAYRERLRVLVTKPPAPPAPVPPEDLMPDQADRVIAATKAALAQTEEDLKAAMFVAAVNTAAQVVEQLTGPLIYVRDPAGDVWSLGPAGTRHKMTGLTDEQLVKIKEAAGTNFNSRKLSATEWGEYLRHWSREV